jgi:hypothetical protein
MKTPIEALLVVAALFVQGCATYVPGVDKTDLSAVYEETATRSEIEAVLGEPVAARTTDEGSISIYKTANGFWANFDRSLWLSIRACNSLSPHLALELAQHEHTAV